MKITYKKKNLFAIAFLLVVSAVICATPAHAQEEVATQDSVAVKRVSMIATDLGISPDQAKVVMEVIDLEKVRASEAIRESQQQLSVKLTGFAAERDKALKEVLTEEQLTKIKAALRRDHALSPAAISPTGIR
jgi:hypothetical protein